MAITWLIEDTFKLGKRKVVRALLRENGTVKRVEVNLARSASATLEDVQAAWDATPALPNGATVWKQLELESTDDIGRNAIGAFLDVVQSNGTLLQMLTALEGVIDDDPKQQAAYTRILTALNGGTPAEQRRFMAAMCVIVYSRLGQRR